jgi:hypothetical protein
VDTAELPHFLPFLQLLKASHTPLTLRLPHGQKAGLPGWLFAPGLANG